MIVAGELASRFHSASAATPLWDACVSASLPKRGGRIRIAVRLKA